MSEMIERVAKEIHNKFRNKHPEYDKLTDSKKTLIKNIAKVAIETMREPTEEMIFNMAEENREIEIWKKLIDAALKE